MVKLLVSFLRSWCLALLSYEVHTINQPNFFLDGTCLLFAKITEYSLNGDLIGDYHETHQRRKQKNLAATNMVFLNEEPATQNHVRNAELAARNQCTNFCWTSKMLGNLMKKSLTWMFLFHFGLDSLAKAYLFSCCQPGRSEPSVGASKKLLVHQATCFEKYASNWISCHFSSPHVRRIFTQKKSFETTNSSTW